MTHQEEETQTSEIFMQLLGEAQLKLSLCSSTTL
jgi:hypothetical protein